MENGESRQHREHGVRAERVLLGQRLQAGV